MANAKSPSGVLLHLSEVLSQKAEDLRQMARQRSEIPRSSSATSDDEGTN